MVMEQFEVEARDDDTEKVHVQEQPLSFEIESKQETEIKPSAGVPLSAFASGAVMFLLIVIVLVFSMKFSHKAEGPTSPSAASDHASLSNPSGASSPISVRGASSPDTRVEESIPMSVDGDRFHISAFLGKTFSKTKLPAEVKTALSNKGFEVMSVKLLKTSMLMTYKVMCVVSNDERHSAADQALAPFPIIVQIIGAELGEMMIVNADIHMSAERLDHAAKLAKRAGVKVPKVYGIGEMEHDCGAVQDDTFDFVLFEHITTATVEDKKLVEHNHPVSWQKIQNDIWTKLVMTPLVEADAYPLPFFPNALAFADYLKGLTSDSSIIAALEKVGRQLAKKESEHTVSEATQFKLGECPDMKRLILTNSKINNGNTLCSPDSPNHPKRSWHLDAVINWDSAAVVSCSIFSNEPSAQHLQKLAHVAKGAWIKEQIASGGSTKVLPRMEYDELMLDYKEHREALEDAGVLKPLSEDVSVRRMMHTQDLKRSEVSSGRRRHL